MLTGVLYALASLAVLGVFALLIVEAGRAIALWLASMGVDANDVGLVLGLSLGFGVFGALVGLMHSMDEGW